MEAGGDALMRQVGFSDLDTQLEMISAHADVMPVHGDGGDLCVSELTPIGGL